MKYKIDKNIPLPKPKGANSTQLTELLRSLDVGDSVELPIHQADGARAIVKRLNIKITTRTLANGTHARLWRSE